MENSPQVLDFVKAVSDADRLRIIGLLARRAATVRQVAEALDMPFREAFAHLGFLEFAGVVHRVGDAFQLDTKAVEGLSQRQLGGGRAAYVPAPGLDAKTRKVLIAYLNPDGSLKQIPMQTPKQRPVLEHLAAAFEPERDYTEKEVNRLLSRFHADTAALRRMLVDAGLLKREPDGSRYWRPG